MAAAVVNQPPPPLVFEVRGRPVPKGSTTAFLVGGKNGGKARAVVAQGGSKARRASLAEWGSAVRFEAMRAIAGGTEAAIEVEVARFHSMPVEVEVEFRLARPKNHYGTGRNEGVLKADAPPFPIGMPDIDKLSRAVLDALTGAAFDDDARVARLAATKVFCDVGREGARIRIAAMGKYQFLSVAPPPDTTEAEVRDALGFSPARTAERPELERALGPSPSRERLLALIDPASAALRPLLETGKRVELARADAELLGLADPDDDFGGKDLP